MTQGDIAAHTIRAESKQPASRRILKSARDLVARGGAGEISMGDVATHAGVSKALVHYHFHDKDSLLEALVENVGTGMIARAHKTNPDDTPAHALDAYWAWIDGELRAGDLRILISLSEYHSDRVRTTCRRIAEQFRAIAADHTSSIFSQLGLAPRIPPPMIAETVLAFVQGLCIAHALNPDHDPRPAFDVLWLALLTLAE